MARDMLNQPMIMKNRGLLSSKKATGRFIFEERSAESASLSPSRLMPPERNRSIQEFCDQTHTLNTREVEISSSHNQSPMTRGKRRGIKSSPKLPQAFREIISANH